MKRFEAHVSEPYCSIGLMAVLVWFDSRWLMVAMRIVVR